MFEIVKVNGKYIMDEVDQSRGLKVPRAQCQAFTSTDAEGRSESSQGRTADRGHDQYGCMVSSLRSAGNAVGYDSVLKRKSRWETGISSAA